MSVYTVGNDLLFVVVLPGDSKLILNILISCGSRWIQLTKEKASILLLGIQRTHYWENLTSHFHVLAVALDGSRDLLLGFVCPLMWYYATILYFGNYYHKDPRERAGLAASAIAALLFTIAAVITVAVIFL
ncbi:hypothetical protein GmHk_16G045357 [Glycine max]|nr:hypothetical protein GmHk_16G045357 [Glycine max]